MKAVKKPLVMPGAAGSSQGNLGRCRVRHGVKMWGVYPKMGELLDSAIIHQIPKQETGWWLQESFTLHHFLG